MTTLDTAFVRSQFPAFAQPALHGQAFFENACRGVVAFGQCEKGTEATASV
jgi:hypothetical protein